MTRLFLILLLLASACHAAWADDAPYRDLQVGVSRSGKLYTLTASFDTPLTACAAYRYLTDYSAAKNLPGVLDSSAYRESANTVKVDRTADEHILFFYVRLHSVMEYTEKPFSGISFTQLNGDSKLFQGRWDIEPKQEGSTLRFKGLWEPDTMIPLFVIDHFAKNGLVEKFEAIARLAEQRKNRPEDHCVN